MMAEILISSLGVFNLIESSGQLVNWPLQLTV